MVLTRQALSEYDARIQKLGDAAYDTVYRRVTQFVKRFPGASVERVRDFTIESVSYAVSVYGDAASTCAADLYDEMAEASGAKLPPAILDTSDVTGYIEKEVRYQAGKYIAGKGEEFASAVAAKATDQVSRRANETMRRNAKRDGLRYARVPMGGETCTFCIMLASRGFVYKSAKTAGEGSHFHAHCRCKVVPQFDKRGRETKVEGYDPDELLDRWDKFKQIDEMRGADGKPVSEFDRRVLKIAYADKHIDYEKVLSSVETHSISAPKLERYALSQNGDANKARAFEGYLGYTDRDAAVVGALVYEHVASNPPEYRDSTPHGDRYTTRMRMAGKDGKSADVKVGWIKEDGAAKMRLTTIFVDE